MVEFDQATVEYLLEMYFGNFTVEIKLAIFSQFFWLQNHFLLFSLILDHLMQYLFRYMYVQAHSPSYTIFSSCVFGRFFQQLHALMWN